MMKLSSSVLLCGCIGAIIVVGLLLLFQTVNAAALPNLFSDGGGGNDGGLDAYKSGLDYGCYDAGIIGNSTERYINQPGKSASYHTEAFMLGYVNGFNACM